jgi:hypothetical protein
LEARIARTRADFDRFSAISKNLETEMWSRVDLNSRPPISHFHRKLVADSATNFLKIKVAVLKQFYWHVTQGPPRAPLKPGHTYPICMRVESQEYILAIFFSIFSTLAIAQ